MTRFRLTAAATVLTLAFGAAAAGGVVAATQSSDEQALQPTRSPQTAGSSAGERLVSKMTLEEKLEQIQLLPDFLVTEAEVRNGLGSVLSVTDPARIRELQRIAVEESRLEDPAPVRVRHHPRLPHDLPDPAGRGRELRPAGRVRRPTYGARESAAVGLKQTYAPMIDVSHEPRWGRIAEAAARIRT